MMAMKAPKGKMPDHPTSEKTGRMLGMSKGAGMKADGMGMYSKGGAVNATKVKNGVGKAKKKSV